MTQIKPLMISNEDLIAGMRRDGPVCRWYEPNRELDTSEVIRGTKLMKIVSWHDELFSSIANMKALRKHYGQEIPFEGPGGIGQPPQTGVFVSDCLLPYSVGIMSYLSETSSKRSRISRGKDFSVLESDYQANGISLVRLFDPKRFEKAYTASLGAGAAILDTPGGPDISKIKGFVATNPIYVDDPGCPVIYIRNNAVYPDVRELSNTKEHEFSHAFSMAFKHPEEIWGYDLQDDGEVEVLVRQHIVDERISNIENGETLVDSFIPPIFLSGCNDSVERYEKLAEQNRNAIAYAREKIKHNYDLGCLLRMTPVQMMGEYLPKIADSYVDAGFNDKVSQTDRYRSGVGIWKPKN